MALKVAFVVKEFIFTRYKAMKMHATRERHKWLPEWKGISLISLLDVTIFIIHSTCIILYHISVILQAVYAYVLQTQQQDISDWKQLIIEMLHVNEQVVSTHSSLSLTRRRGELTKTFRAVLVWTFFSSILMKPFFSTSTLPIFVKRRNAQTSNLWSHKAEAATDTASYSIEWTIEADQWWKHLQLLAGLRLTFCLAFRECSKCPFGSFGTSYGSDFGQSGFLFFHVLLQDALHCVFSGEPDACGPNAHGEMAGRCLVIYVIFNLLWNMAVLLSVKHTGALATFVALKAIFPVLWMQSIWSSKS